MMRVATILCVIVLSTSCVLVSAEEWRAGVASISITPKEPIHLLGYPNRAKPFESVNADIHAKAVAIKDELGNRGVIVTSDLVGFQDAYSAAICERICQRHKLERRQI